MAAPGPAFERYLRARRRAELIRRAGWHFAFGALCVGGGYLLGMLT